jgi:hypothetical protein
LVTVFVLEITGTGIRSRCRSPGVAARVLAAAAAVAVDVRVKARVQMKICQVGAGPAQRREPGSHQHRVACGVGDVGGDERYPCSALVAVTVQAMPVGSAATVYVMSRACRSVNVAPSVTMYWSVLTSVLSMVGS